MMHSFLEYRNAQYVGVVDQHRFRQGVGLLVTDDCEVLLADWHDGVIHGKYFYTDGKKSAYGSMRYGRYEGDNVFVEQPWTVYGECQGGKLHGRVKIEYENGSSQVHTFRAGQRQAQIDSLEVAYAPQVTQLQYHLLIDELIKKTDYLGIDRFAIGKVYYGMTNEASNASGLGFVLRSGRLYSAGMYADGKQNGVGRCYHPNEIHDGTFKDDELCGVGCKWITSSKEYVFAEYRPSRYKILSKGKGDFPSKPVRRVREEFHIRSLNYINDWVLIRKLITIEISGIVRTYTRRNLKIEIPGSSIQQTFSTNGQINRITEAALFLESPTRNTPKSKKSKKAYSTSPIGAILPDIKYMQPALLPLNDLLNEAREPHQDSLCLHDKLKTVTGDPLLDAIREYQQLKTVKRRSRTPKRKN